MSKMRQYGCCTVILGMWFFIAAFASTPAMAQEASESQVKAAFLYNFAKFVEWPQGAFAGSNSPVVIGVVESDSFARTLEETVSGRTIGGRAIRVKALAADGDLKSCHIVYILTKSERRTAAILAQLSGASVLTVGDSPNFAHIGGVINFFVQDARVRFEINPAAADRAHLKISAKLLALAKVVRGNSTGR